MDILHAIGNTSMVRLRKVVPAKCADIVVKLEWENPTGSMKDRMADAVISRAETDGRLKPGGTVVEYTGGSTGASLALVCAAKGYRIQIVTSDAFSPEKREHMAALGAELTLVRSEGGLTTKKLILDMIEVARGLSRKPDTYWTDQLNNHDSIAGYYSLGEEIWNQTKGKIDAFVHCVGTAASSRGVATVLKRYKPDIKIVAVEPAESSVLLGGQAGPHKIEGVGIGYTPPLWEPTLVDEILPVKTEDAKEMARRLAREEALFAGSSSGANVVAAIQAAERLGPGATVVTLMADSGLKYLSTAVRSASLAVGLLIAPALAPVLPIDKLVPENPELRLVTVQELKAEGYTDKQRERPYLTGDFNADGKPDVAMCLVRPNGPDDKPGFLLIVTKGPSGWIREFFQPISFAVPDVGWDKKDRVLYVSTPAGHDAPSDEIKWNAKSGAYERLPGEVVDYP